jgi:hypothetical protein
MEKKLVDEKGKMTDNLGTKNLVHIHKRGGDKQIYVPNFLTQTSQQYILPCEPGICLCAFCWAAQSPVALHPNSRSQRHRPQVNIPLF